MKIQAHVKYIPRVKIPCPNDGVHVAGTNGEIKGVHALMFDDKLVFKGSNGFFWETGNGWGIKVYFSFGWFGCAKKKFVLSEKENMVRLHKIGLAPETGSMVNIKLELVYKDKRIKTTAIGIPVQKIHYPKKALENYAKGNPYDWDAIDEDWHSPQGFLKFRDDAKKKIKKAGIKFLGSLKLGDILPDIYLKQWFIVDAGK